MQIRELRCEKASCSCRSHHPHAPSPHTQEHTCSHLSHHTTHHTTPQQTTTHHNTPQHTTPTAAAVPQHTRMPRSPKSRSPRWTMTSLFSSGFSSSRRTAITTQREDSVNEGATTASPELFFAQQHSIMSHTHTKWGAAGVYPTAVQRNAPTAACLRPECIRRLTVVLAARVATSQPYPPRDTRTRRSNHFRV